MPVLHHAVAGENALELRVSAVPAEDGEEATPSTLAGANALLRLVWFSDGQVTNSDLSGRIVAELRYPPPSTIVPADAESAALDGKATLAAAVTPGRPSWMDAGVTNLSTALLDQLEPQFSALARVIERGDYDAFVAMWRPYLDDYARAYPEMGWRGVEKVHRGWLDEIAKEGGRVELAPRRDWIARLVGGGRLVDVRGEDGAPVITIVQGDRIACPYPALVGLAAGRPIWTQ